MLVANSHVNISLSVWLVCQKKLMNVLCPMSGQSTNRCDGCCRHLQWVFPSVKNVGYFIRWIILHECKLRDHAILMAVECSVLGKINQVKRCCAVVGCIAESRKYHGYIANTAQLHPTFYKNVRQRRIWCVLIIAKK